MAHEHKFERRDGVLICDCGESAIPYWRGRGDWDRWNGHKGIILKMLARRGTVSMSTIKVYIDSANPSTHISALRKDGFVITCTREGNESFYTMEGFTGTDNTTAAHCPNCGYALATKAND